ncbi:MAG: hypothetical protein ACTSX6_12460 [Candidatus Heimdallarchaeaceae archaeon]
MKVKADIKTQLSKLLEDNLREDICKPLLTAFGAHSVEKYHGSAEEGKDVYFAYQDLFTDYKHCCLFIKAGNITKSGKNDIRKIKTAIEEALFSPFVDPLNNNAEVYIQEFYFVCNGKLNYFARRYLVNIFKTNKFPNFKIVDIDKLTESIRKIISFYKNRVDNKYIFNVKTFRNFCNKIVSFREQFQTQEIKPGVFLD